MRLAMALLVATLACSSSAGVPTREPQASATTSPTRSAPAAADATATAVATEPATGIVVSIGDPHLRFIPPPWPHHIDHPGHATFSDGQGGVMDVSPTLFNAPFSLSDAAREWTNVADTAKRIVKPYRRATIELAESSAALFDYQIRLNDGGLAEEQTYLFVC